MLTGRSYSVLGAGLEERVQVDLTLRQVCLRHHRCSRPSKLPVSCEPMDEQANMLGS